MPQTAVSIAQGIITIDTIERKETQKALGNKIKPLRNNSKANKKLTVRMYSRNKLIESDCRYESNDIAKFPETTINLENWYCFKMLPS